MNQKMDLQAALELIEKLRSEIVELKAENMKMEENWEEEAEIYSEIHLENKFLKKRVNDLEQSYETINDELKRIKNKYEINSLEQFMNHYGLIMERADIKVIQGKYFEETGIKFSIQQLKRELEQIGYQVKNCKIRNSYFVSKNTEGYIYIVQLNKHEGTNIYKVGRSLNMHHRLNTYRHQYGGANEITCLKVNDYLNAEAKLLMLLNEAVDRNELRKDSTGAEYFEGQLELIKKIFNEVIAEYN